jgi:uncharacterized tellurite resistance protein B-like protein
MFEAVRRFIAGVTADSAGEKPVADDELHLAAAALLYHVIAADGVVSEGERRAVKNALSQQYALDQAAADELVGKARDADLEAVDFYRFTRTLKARLDDEGRKKVVALMWRMVFADGQMDEFEDNIVWRVAELLDVPARERVLLKKEAEHRNTEAAGD